MFWTSDRCSSRSGITRACCRGSSSALTLRRHGCQLLRQRQSSYCWFFDVCVLFLGALSIAGNDETVNVADLSDEFRSFAWEAKALVDERQQQCLRLSKIRPRASRSSSHCYERWEPLSSGTSVPCTRSPESAGQFFVNFVMGLMVGDRRFPGATILGRRSSTSSANHPASVPPTGSVHRDGFSFGFVLGLRFTLPEALRRRF